MTYFISGIDTNIGKSYATGFLAREFMECGVSVVTQKMVQTGNVGRSEDIELHRSIMGVEPMAEDLTARTFPSVFAYPASPHFAARLEGREVDVDAITRATRELEHAYEVVLLEGAGGLMVPLTDNLLTIDYVAAQGYPVVLVTSGRLGSLNHTLLSMEALCRRGMELMEVIYNDFDEADPAISADSFDFIATTLARDFPAAIIRHMPTL